METTFQTIAPDGTKRLETFLVEWKLVMADDDVKTEGNP